MNIIIFGAGGFIGTNLVIRLAEDQNNHLLLVDKDINKIKKIIGEKKNVVYYSDVFSEKTDFDNLLNNQDVVYHLVSTNAPSTSNIQIADEIQTNVISTINMLESCVKNKVKRVIFLSSGGTVYGKDGTCPLDEEAETNPISSYGIQKLTIEKILYLYNHLYGLDYRIIRLANPYGPHQNPNGMLGAVTTFTYKALNNEPIYIYGDGEIIRDYIYIDDAIEGIVKISNGNSRWKVFNLGTGKGISLIELLKTIEKALNIKMNILFKAKRNADVPINYLNIDRYIKEYGKYDFLPLLEGIKKTAKYLKEYH